MKKIQILAVFAVFIFSCTATKKYDLVISHATVLDVKTGKMAHDQTILVTKNKIEAIVDNSQIYEAIHTVDAKGKLVTPGLIDPHIHPTDVFGDYEKAPKHLPADSLNILREKLSKEYLPFGTTTVLTMGQPENWLKDLLVWQKNPDAKNVDFYVCGGALISTDNRTPYIGHTELASPAMARKKLLEYHRLGINHIKLYYRLKEPEFSTVIQLADSLKMKVYGHIGDFNPEYMTICQTLKLGLKNYEHLATIPNSIMVSDDDWAKLDKQFKENFGELNSESKMIEFFLEQFRYIKENRDKEMQAFIQELKANGVTFSTTLHRLYEQIAPAFFTRQKDTALTEKQLERCRENFAVMMTYVKQMYDAGIAIRLGSDMPNGGKVNISELIILAKYGFSIPDVFRIATINGAKAMGIEHETGSIEKGKKANLVIWEKSPFENIENFAAPKTIIKDGEVFP